MGFDKHAPEGFVRKDLLRTIKDKISAGKSMKLIAAREMGTTYILKQIHHCCLNDWAEENFKPFYLCSKYDRQSVCEAINQQLSEMKVTPTISADMSLRQMVRATRAAVIEDLNMNKSETTIVFIMDDFYQGLGALHEGQPKYETLLDADNINQIKEIVDRPRSNERNIVFIIQYYLPYSMEPREDWYLFGLDNIEVELLSEAEANSLIRYEMKRKKKKFNNKTKEKIIYYGGRHPGMLSFTCRSDLSNARRQSKFEKRIIRRYIYTHSKFYTDDKILRRIAKTGRIPKVNQFVEEAVPELFEKYLYKDKDGYHVYSEHYREYLEGARGTREWRSFALLVFLTIFLIPLLVSLILELIQVPANRVLHIFEADHFGFSTIFWHELLGRYKIMQIIGAVYGLNIAVLVSLMIKSKYSVTWCLPHLRGKELSFRERLLHLYTNGMTNLAFSALIVVLTSITIITPEFFGLAGEQSADATEQLIYYSEAYLAYGKNEERDFRLRSIWALHSEMNPHMYQRKYLLVTPIILSLPNNYSSAVQRAALYLRSSWNSFLGMTEEENFIHDREIALLIDKLSRSNNVDNLLNMYMEIWKNDCINDNVMETLKQAKQLGIIDSDTIKFLSSNQGTNGRINKAGGIIYINLKASVNVAKDDPSNPYVSMMKHIISAYSRSDMQAFHSSTSSN